MKILFVSEDIPAHKLGGLGKHVVTLANAFITAGHEVALMGRNTPEYSECAEEVGFRGRFIPGFIAPLKGWKERQLGVFIPWKRPYFARRLAQAIQSYATEFDVVHYHGHLPMVGRYIPTSVHFVQTRHDQGGDCITNLRFKQGSVCVDRSPSACATCIHPNPGNLRTKISTIAVKRYRADTEEAFALHPTIFVSSFLRDNYMKTSPNARLSHSNIIHNFVDQRALNESLDPEKGKVTKNFQVHVAGRLDEAKGIAALLELLTPRLPLSWIVNIYGDGPLRSEIESKYSSDSIRLHGHRPYREILLATQNASVVVVPSIWEEPCGTVILEALRLGKICFALRRGGTPELARYGKLGQLQLFEDMPALVNALLLAEDYQISSGGDSADVEVHMHELMKIYKRLVGAI